MPPDLITAPDALPVEKNKTSLPAKLLNVLAWPGEVFDEIAVEKANLLHWFVPTLLACLSGILAVLSYSAHSADALQPIAKPVGNAIALMVCIVTVAGSLWSAFVLWFVGQFFLQARFSFFKAMEIVGVTEMVLALGTIVTALLAIVSGSFENHPSLALLIKTSHPVGAMHSMLDLLNVFHLWSASLLALGLARLSGVAFKECAFWVFGYWILARLSLILLGD
jgi:hypothetical protein